jgi:GNAT superfamily N-acetyltransferase
VATASDVDGLTETVSLAFRDDPLWSWAFPDPTRIDGWWRFLIGSALRYPWTWVAGDYAAVAVWIPPSGVELTEEEEERLEPLLKGLDMSRAPAIMQLLERFEDSHPHERPHYYLSLLGTHPDHRGKGYGMGLLEENLRQIDDAGMPAYLESSNPANDRRYEKLGFTRTGAFSTPDGQHSVSTMWREPA